jgi:DNA-binding MarR family transcriptional regulator
MLVDNHEGNLPLKWVTILAGVDVQRAGPEPVPDHLRLVQEVVGLWVQMQSRLQAHFAALAAEHSLSAIQAKVLIQLDQAGSVTMRALADRLQYDPSNLTTVIDRLEELGAVERRPDPRDRRVKGIVLTGKGLSLRTAFWQRLINAAGPLGGLGTGELVQLRSLLQHALASPGQRPDGRPGQVG